MNQPKPRGITKLKVEFQGHRIPLKTGIPTWLDLMLPTDWLCRDATTQRGDQQGDMAPAAIAIPSQCTDAILSAWITHLDREIAPADWLTAFLEQRNETAIDDDRLPPATDREAFALASGVDHQGEETQAEYTAGWAVHKRGALLVIVRVALAGNMLSRRSIARAIATESRVGGGTEFPFAETLRRIAPEKPVDFVTLYPEKWEKTSELTKKEVATSILLRDTREGKSVGEISLMTFPDRPGTTADSLMKTITGYVTKDALVSPRLRPKPAEVPAGATAAWTSSATVPREGFNSEIEVHVFRTETGWMILSHWRLAREHNARQWAISRRAMELVLRYLRFEAPKGDDADYAELNRMASSPEADA